MTKKYKFTKEHKSLIPEHNKKWIDIILNTDRLSEKDKELCVNSVNKMYDIAKLDRPKSIVFVSSPLVLAFAGGLSRFILNKRNKTEDSATRSATDSATLSATDSATRSATASATDSATRSATRSATLSATDSATYSATLSATYSNRKEKELSDGVVCHENFTDSVLNILEELNMLEYEKEAFEYIRSVTSIWQGGCNWAQYDCFLSFFQDVVKLDIDYSNYEPYKDLTVAGFRILDREFAMISEKPISIKMKNSLAHNLEGPAIEYMDGTKLYMAYGNLIPSWIITTPKSQITKEMILQEKNADFRRYLIERIGIERYLNILGECDIIDSYESSVGGKYELIKVNINDEETTYLKMKNQSEFVYHVEGVPNEIKTVKQALMFRNGMKNFKEPKFLS